MTFQEQLIELSNDVNVMEYFENRNFTEFVKTHIQIEYLLQEKCQSSLLDKLNNLQNKSTDNTVKELLNIITLQLNKPTFTFMKELTYSLDNHPKLNSIDQTLCQLQKNFSSSSSKKGQVTENILFNNLTTLCSDSDVINSSHIPNSGDIQIVKLNKPMILIDSKNFVTNVPKVDLDKFYNDVHVNNCSGILCNSNAGIANREHFEIDIQNNNVYIFICNHQYDNTLFKLAIKIIYNIHNIIKNNKVDIIELDKELFNRLKLEYNYFLSQFHQYLESIKTNIMSLEKLAFNQLEQFFKHTICIENKPFSCSICGISCTSNKTLKTHIKNKHA